MCCLRAAWVGGMFSSILPLGAKSCFLASFISIMPLVRPYKSTTNLSSRDIGSSLTSEGMHSSSTNALVTSGNALHVVHAVFFPLTEKKGTSCEGMEDGKTGAVPWIHCGHLMDRYASKI